MEFLSELAFGFATVLSPTNLVICIGGALLGVVAAILPGISAAAAISLALPLSFGLAPMTGILLMISIALGSLYGRPLAALLLAGFEPGRSQADKGMPSFAWVTIASVTGGIVATILVVVLASVVSTIGLSLLAPAEYAAIIIFVLIVGAALAPGRISRAIAVIVLGLLLSTVGSDLETGAGRLTFDIAELADGLGFVNLALGVFVVTDMIRGLTTPGEGRSAPGRAANVSALGIGSGSTLGFLAGILPSSGTSLTFAADDAEVASVVDPLDPAGQESVDQIPGAAAASSARLSASFLPLLSLGIPTNAVAALLLAGLTIHGIVPGPQFATKQPQLFWGVLAAFIFIPCVLLALLALMMLLGRSLAALSQVSYRSLAPIILAYACFAIYTVNNSAVDVFFMLGFGALGYFFTRSDCERGLFLIAFVLGPLLEENVRRSLLVASGNFILILERPIVATLLGATVVLVLGARMWQRRAEVQ
jgi:putative tricarboxylic transport membrane protein